MQIYNFGHRRAAMGRHVVGIAHQNKIYASKCPTAKSSPQSETIIFHLEMVKCRFKMELKRKILWLSPGMVDFAPN